jgi:molecular chaperone DnaK (HSP70)
MELRRERKRKMIELECQEICRNQRQVNRELSTNTKTSIRIYLTQEMGVDLYVTIYSDAIEELARLFR